MIRHGACGRTWTGRDRNHCGGCHQTFATLAAFDRHHRGRRCLSPAEAGLDALATEHGPLWHVPGVPPHVDGPRRAGPVTA